LCLSESSIRKRASIVLARSFSSFQGLVKMEDEEEDEEEEEEEEDLRGVFT
jgi:hypothetical protein